MTRDSGDLTYRTAVGTGVLSRRSFQCSGIAIRQPSILGYLMDLAMVASYIRCMLPLYLLGEQIAIKRKSLGLTKPTLAKKARVGLSTLDALENGRMGELGYSKITNILAALGLELKLQLASASRPTLEELIEEARDGQDLDRRR
jgi:hypothetical protein